MLKQLALSGNTQSGSELSPRKSSFAVKNPALVSKKSTAKKISQLGFEELKDNHGSDTQL